MGKEEKKGKKFGFSLKIGGKKISYEGRISDIVDTSKVRDLSGTLNSGIETAKNAISSGASKIGKIITEVGQSIEKTGKTEDQTKETK